MPQYTSSGSKLVWPLTVAAAALMANDGLGEGFRNSPAGGFSLARAGGRIAQIDTPAAVQHNPANLVHLESAAIEIAPTFVYINTEHRNLNGQSAETTDPWKLVPAAFASIPLCERAAVGFGFTTPFGLANEWEETGAFGPGGSLRYAAPHFAEMATVNFNPALSFKVTDQLSVGVGLDVYYSQLKIRQYYPWAPFGGAGESEFRVKGDGTGYGGNLGITWEPVKGHRIAATYRSAFTVDYDGTGNVNDIPPAAASFGASGVSSFTSEIEFPTIVALGYGVEINEKLRLEINGEWLEFSNFKSLDLQLGNNNVLFGGAPSLNQDWKNSYTAGIAGDYNVCANWWVLAGYQFYKSPVPDHTFTTTIPDSDQHALTSGLRYKGRHHSAELGYSYVIYEDRDIRANGAFNGSYETTLHLITASYIYSF